MTSPNDQKLQQKAAEALEDLSRRVDEGYAEISRCYSILAVLHQVAKLYLGSVPIGETEEEEEAIAMVEDAVWALENNATVDQARLSREEEITE
jgi:hypothetical protein